MNHIKAVMCDIDGTLLNDHGIITFKTFYKIITNQFSFFVIIFICVIYKFCYFFPIYKFLFFFFALFPDSENCRCKECDRFDAAGIG